MYILHSDVPVITNAISDHSYSETQTEQHWAGDQTLNTVTSAVTEAGDGYCVHTTANNDNPFLQADDDTAATQASDDTEETASLLEESRTFSSGSLPSQTTLFNFDKIDYGLPVCAVVLSVAETIMLISLYEDVSSKHAFSIAYACMRALYFLFDIIVIVIGFCLSTRFRSKHAGYNSSTALFLLCTFCLFVFDIFRIIADVGVQVGSQSKDPSVPDYRNTTSYTLMYTDITRGVIMTGTVLDLVQVFLQTSFLLHIMQLTPVCHSRHLTSQQYRLFKSVLIVLILYNGFDWMRISFVTGKSGSSGLWLIASYFPNYAQLLRHVIVPVLVFYYFQSFVYFLLIYIQF